MIFSKKWSKKNLPKFFRGWRKVISMSDDSSEKKYVIDIRVK
jgi:hypothetical protein